MAKSKNKKSKSDTKKSIEPASANRQLTTLEQKLKVVNQQLKASNQQLRASEQQLKASNQQLKANEEELNKSRRLYKALFEGSINAIAVYEVVDGGNDFVFKDFNPAGERIEKIKREDVIGKSVIKVFPGVKEYGLFDVFKRVWNTGKSEHFGISLYQDQRISGWRENYVFKLGSGEIVASYADVTERKQAEAALRKSEERFRHLYERFPMAYQSLDAEGNIIEVNPAWLSLLGYEKEAVIGRPFTDFLTSGFPELFKEQFPRFKAAGEASSVPFEMVRKDGSGIDVEIDGKVGYKSDGSFKQTHCVLHDITKRRRAEEEVLKKSEQLRALASRLSSIEEEERRHIAEGIHDRVLQPLVFLDVTVGTLLNAAKDNKMIKSFKRMRTILAELIEISRTFTFDLSYPILYELGLEIAIKEWLQTEIKDKHEIAVEFRAETQTNDLDQSMIIFLFKSFKELLINVVKHAGANKVKVSLARRYNNIILCVEDDGCGFDYDSYRLQHGKLSGFGLFNIREQLTYLGGNFNVESKAGVGSEVVLTVPLEGKN